MLAALATTRMLHLKRILVLCALTLAMLMDTSDAAAQTANSHADGWVSRVDGTRLEICFDHAALPAIGQTMQLLRTHDVMLNNKGVTRRTFMPEGITRIVSIGQPPCVMAALLDGKAQRSDHARAQDSSLPTSR
jgi:hypothetical protein